jgi:hypothetical protein
LISFDNNLLEIIIAVAVQNTFCLKIHQKKLFLKNIFNINTSKQFKNIIINFRHNKQEKIKISINTIFQILPKSYRSVGMSMDRGTRIGEFLGLIRQYF